MMNLLPFVKLSLGELTLKNLQVNGIQIYKSGYKNWVPYSLDTDGSVFNGVGYKDGYRLRSGGGLAEVAGGRVTGYIPVTAGDIVRLTGWNFDFAVAANAVNFSDSTFTNLGQITMQPAAYGICAVTTPTVTSHNGVFMFTVPNNVDIRYLRVSGLNENNIPIPEMIITINEEIK
jgi:hypothetical protein